MYKFAFLSFALLFSSCTDKRQHEETKLEDFIQAQSAIGTEEDPRARLNYELNMLVDPATGKLPKNIRKNEIKFSRQVLDRREINRNDRARSTAAYEAGEWQRRGPFNVGGRTRALALDVNDENIIMAGGVSGGMWRSTNGGRDWQKTTNPENIQSVTCISQDHRLGKTNTWYYGTGELIGNSARGGDAPFRGDGIFKSSDQGLSWTKLASTDQGEANDFTSPFQYIWNIVTNRYNAEQDEILVAAYGCILRSTDGGNSWQTVLGADLINSNKNLNTVEVPFYTDIAQAKDGTYYATLSQEGPLNFVSEFKGIYRSKDGVNWIDITPSFWPQMYSRTVISISPSDPDIVYFLCEAVPVRFARFTFQGEIPAGIQGNWQDLSQDIKNFGGRVGDFNTQGSYNMVLAVHPDKANVVYLGATNLYRYTLGESFEWIGGYDPENNGDIYPNHYVDQHAIVFYPGDPDKMLTGNDGGVQVTNNNRAEKVSFVNLNNGYMTSQFYTIGMDRSRINNIVFGGMQDNGTFFTNNAFAEDSWDRVLGGDGGYCAVSKDGLFYYVSFQRGQIYRLTFNQNNQISSFARVDPVRKGRDAVVNFIFVTPYVLDPSNSNQMYLAGSNVIWKNRNLAQVPSGSQEPTEVNWYKINNSQLDIGLISALEISTQPANILYYGTNTGRVFKINDASINDPQVQEITSPDFRTGAYVSCISIDPSNADRILVIFSNYNVISIFYSENGGELYTNVSGNLEEKNDGSGNGPSIRWGKIIPLADGNDIFVVGTSTGVYTTSRLEGINTIWVRESPDLMGNVVVPMMDYRSLDGQLVVATHGNGVYAKKFAQVKIVEPLSSEGDFQLNNAYPNPFTERTIISFSLPEDGLVKADIYNSQGQIVNNLFHSFLYAGANQLSWNGTDESGSLMANGNYIIRLEYNGSMFSRQVMLRK